MQTVILISAALGRTPLLKLRPQTPPLKKENPRPAAPGESLKGGRPLQTINKSPPEALARQIWLHYFNDYLRERNIITEDEWRKLRQKIG